MDGVRKEIEGGYRLLDAHTVAFAVGQYDRSQPLVIDPLLIYSTYFGGSAGETAYAVALDPDGNVYITGQTFSQDFGKPGAYQTNFAGGKLTGDAFVFNWRQMAFQLTSLIWAAAPTTVRSAWLWMPPAMLM